MRITAAAKEETRQRIVSAALESFKTQGFEAATTRDIARAAGLAIGTLFNYFPTKEALVEALLAESCAKADEAFFAAAEQDSKNDSDEPPSLEEDLFAYVAAHLRKLKPHRKYLAAVLETSLSPLAGQESALRAAHLERVTTIAARHGCQEALTAVALQLYWTLYTGVLAFWSRDASPRQEDTLALLDQSIAMFVGWLLPAGPVAKSLPAKTLPRNGG